MPEPRALGTHQGMSDEHLGRHLGYQPGELKQTYPGWQILNHEFWLPETFTTVGTISADRIAELTRGLLTDTAVDVRINRHVAEADVAIVVGPVFPHEVVGFFGGNKYFFPGVSGPEVINLSHWVGALITSAEMIGTRGYHPCAGLDRRSGEHDSGKTLGFELGGGVGNQHPACRGLWYAGRLLGRLCRHLVADPRQLS